MAELSLRILLLEADPSISNVSEASPYLTPGTNVPAGSLLSEEPLEAETELEYGEVDLHLKEDSRSLLIEDLEYLLDDVVCEHVLDV